MNLDTLMEWGMARFTRPRKPGLVTLPEPPEYVKEAVQQNDDLRSMFDAWAAYDNTMLLADNDSREADKAFAAVRAERRQRLKDRAKLFGDDDDDSK